MEKTVGPCRNGFISIYSSRTDYADRGSSVFHNPALDGRRVGSEQNIGSAVYEESVLHVSGRMIGSKIKRRKNVPVIFDFRTFSYSKA